MITVEVSNPLHPHDLARLEGKGTRVGGQTFCYLPAYIQYVIKRHLRKGVGSGLEW